MLPLPEHFSLWEYYHPEGKLNVWLDEKIHFWHQFRSHHFRPGPFIWKSAQTCFICSKGANKLREYGLIEMIIEKKLTPRSDMVSLARTKAALETVHAFSLVSKDVTFSTISCVQDSRNNQSLPWKRENIVD